MSRKNKTISSMEPVGGLARHPILAYVISFIAFLAFLMLTYEVVTNGPLTRYDLPIVQSVHQIAIHGSRWLILLAFALSSFGRDGIALMSLIVGIIYMRQRRWREFSLIFMGVAVGEGIFQVLSNWIHRHRPVFPNPLEQLPGPGFPSGHAVTAVALFGLCVYLLWPKLPTTFSKIVAVLAAVGMCLAIGWARLYLGDHYPTDLIAGFLVGISWSLFIYTVIELVFERQRYRSKPEWQRQRGLAPK